MTIKTYNSKFDINGNRRNLIVNYDTKQFYYNGGHAFSLGVETDNLGIREVDRMKKELISEGYEPVSHAHVRDNWYK